MRWDDSIRMFTSPAPDPTGVAALNATIAALSLGVLAFLIARYYARREELQEQAEELATIGHGALVAPLQKLPELPVGDYILQAESKGTEFLFAELEHAIQTDLNSEKQENLAAIGAKITALVAALALIPPMPRRYFHLPNGRLLFFLGTEERASEMKGSRQTEISMHGYRLIGLIRKNPPLVESALKAADASGKGGHAEAVEAFLAYTSDAMRVAERVIRVRSRIHRFEEERIERRLLRWAVPPLTVAFLLGVTTPLFFPSAPLWIDVGIPQLIYVVGLTMLAFLAWRR